MRLVLVRHGQTPSNVVRALDTALPGAPLDEVGTSQAQALARNWDSIVGSEPDLVAVSPLTRTRQTAQPLLERFNLTPQLDERLREVIAGDLEMRSDLPSVEKYLQVVFDWISGQLDTRMPGAEDGHETLARLHAGVDAAVQAARVQYPDRDDLTVVVVAHGVVCRLLANTLAQNVPAALVANFPMHNATTTVLESTDGKKWRALSWSDEPIESFDLQGLASVPVVSGLRQGTLDSLEDR
ncbi:MAG: histidine phosphatase family protein [Actinomycetaceae bacterium]|nr:histidine phosphatase family protein [Actinomycetaceae bacterium]